MLKAKVDIKKDKGFTLIELLLYLAIVSTVIMALIYFSIETTKAGVKSQVKQETVANTRYVTDRLNYELRNALNINTSVSNFGVNFATNSSYQLSLSARTPNNPTIFRVSGGKLQINQGGAGFQDINSPEVNITNLVFTNNTSSDSKTKHISYTITMEANNSGITQEYQDSITLKSSVELRTH